MNMASMMKDFFGGLARGFGLYLFERSEPAYGTVAQELHFGRK